MDFTISPHLSVDPLIEMGAEGAITMVATTEGAITMVVTTEEAITTVVTGEDTIEVVTTVVIGEDTIEVVIEMAEVLKEVVTKIIKISGNLI